MTTLGMIKKGAVALGLIAGLGSAAMANVNKQDHCFKRNGVVISEADLSKCNRSIPAAECYQEYEADCTTPVGDPVLGTWVD